MKHFIDLDVLTGDKKGNLIIHENTFETIDGMTPSPSNHTSVHPVNIKRMIDNALSHAETDLGLTVGELREAWELAIVCNEMALAELARYWIDCATRLIHGV